MEGKMMHKKRKCSEQKPAVLKKCLLSTDVACGSHAELEHKGKNIVKSQGLTDHMEESDDQDIERCLKQISKIEVDCKKEEDKMSLDNNHEDTRKAAQGSDDYQDKKSSGTGEDIMTQREFNDLDVCDGNEEDDCGLDIDSDVPNEEIEAMLEKGYQEETSKNGETEGNNDLSYKERKIFVMEDLNHNHFEMLPDGWVKMNHISGIPIFLHIQSRVCTLSKPYFLGSRNAKEHEIPLSAIPCLQYRRALETKAVVVNKKEEKQVKEEGKKIAEANLVTNAGFPTACIETLVKNDAQQSLSAAEVRDYCDKLFQFKTVKSVRFKSWSERKKYRQQMKQENEPTLLEETKLIKIPIKASGCLDSGNTEKEWIINPIGKTYTSILHEYVQRVLKKRLTYTVKELENIVTPYSATVSINDLKYGVGFGTSKKQAKSEAAKATIQILIPEVMRIIQANEKNGSKAKQSSSNSYLSIFDEIKIEDPCVAELCAKTNEPSPYSILLTCLKRNSGSGDRNIKYELNTLNHKKNEFIMTVGNDMAKVICKNKREGKQRASQIILQALHPNITSWGSILRLYGNFSNSHMKEKKQKEQEITSLQRKATTGGPNHAILNKLKTEMMKIRAKQASVQPTRNFNPLDGVALPSTSGAALNKVDL